MARGNVYAAKKEHVKAIADYTKAISLNVDCICAFINRGQEYDELGRQDKALADYNRAIQMYPNDPDGYDNRGYEYGKLHLHQKAIADYTKALSLDPKDDYAREMREDEIAEVKGKAGPKSTRAKAVTGKTAIPIAGNNSRFDFKTMDAWIPQLNAYANAFWDKTNTNEGFMASLEMQQRYILGIDTLFAKVDFRTLSADDRKHIRSSIGRLNEHALGLFTQSSTVYRKWLRSLDEGNYSTRDLFPLVRPQARVARD